MSDGKTITVSRVNGRGQRTGDTDLSVRTVTGGVQVKLGTVRAIISTRQWAEIIQGTLGSGPVHAGTVTIRVWDTKHSMTEPALEITGWPGVPQRGDLLRLPWRAAARVDDVVWNITANAVDVHIR